MPNILDPSVGARLVVPGGSYGEVLPTGEFAVLVPHQHIETHLTVGQIPLPHANGWIDPAPLFLRISQSFLFGFQICAQPSLTAREGGVDGTWHWRAGAWSVDPRRSNGQSGAIFDRDGILEVIEPGVGATSQGYRYVADDGRLVLGDATYYDPSLQVTEYTSYLIDGERVTVGQDHEGAGAVAIFRGVRTILEPEVGRFIRFSHAAHQLAVALLTPISTILRRFSLEQCFPACFPPQKPDRPERIPR